MHIYTAAVIIAKMVAMKMCRVTSADEETLRILIQPEVEHVLSDHRFHVSVFL